MSHFCLRSQFYAKVLFKPIIGLWAFKFVKHLRVSEFKRFDWRNKNLDRKQKSDIHCTVYNYIEYIAIKVLQQGAARV